MPKAGLAGHVFDLRVVVIAGRARHAVVRMSRGPMTNLHLLNRRGAFSSTEFELVKQHPAEGVRLLRSMGYESEPLLAMVRDSHEAWDGSGYPNGLRGEDIPRGARIVAVADTYDALTSWRPTREPWARDAALDEIREGGAVGRYDPEVVAALTKLLG